MHVYASMAWRAVLLASVAAMVQGFYIPGVAPKEYADGEDVEVKAVKMTSTQTFLPFQYYSLPFCRPKKLVFRKENLGEVLRGDRISNTPYTIKMNRNVTCQLLCPDALAESQSVEFNAKQVNKFIQRIKQEYRAHFIVDNLPSATKMLVDDVTTYLHGFPIGYVDSENNANLFNHITIVIKIHQAVEGSHRIVGFEIKAGSFDQAAYSIDEDERSCKIATKNDALPPPVVMTKLEGDATQKVIWSYGVRFEPSDVAWASRWDTYLKMADVEIHWFSIINSFITVLFLSAIFGAIIVRTLSNDIAKYNEESDDDVEPTGWKLVHGDVFRAPILPGMLCSFIGTGVQIFGVFAVTIFFALLGMLSPSSRGALMTTAIVVWLFMGASGGYYSARMFKTLGGTQWKQQALWTACLFPGIAFGSGFFVNFFIWHQDSSGAVPFTTMIALLMMWFGGSVPLNLAGAYFGYRKEPYAFPVGVNTIQRPIPEQQWFLTPAVSVMLAGILPFGAVFIELFFILNAIWENQFYYMFGFLFLVFLVLIVSCTVRIFRQTFTLEDAIGSHACSLEASRRVTNDISLRCPLSYQFTL
jgi:transmembrane 9 superfamily protein 2/4